jgi:predicted regulator of Ras-like GTPase activity (Roadblock/LC7/MglB family)
MRSPEIGWLLDDLVARVPGAEKALLLSRDGLCIAASVALPRADAERLAAMASAIHSLARGAVQHLGGEEVRRVVVEMSTAFFLTTAAGEGSCLAVVSSGQADIGLLAYEMAMLVRRVNEHLAVRPRPVPSGGEVM